MKTKFVLPLALLLITGFALAVTQTVTTKDGRKITGEVTRTDTGYSIKTKAGPVMTVRTDEVATIETASDAQQEYEQRLAKIDPNSAEDHYNLGKWAYDNNLLQAAHNELVRALEIKKDYDRAALLLRQVDARIAVEKPAAATTTKAAEGVKDGLVSDDDIYRVRLAELKKGDSVVIEFRNKVIDRFLEAWRGKEEFRDPKAADEFRAMPNIDKALFILDKTGNAPRYADDILIKSDPKFMVEFRSQIWPTVAQSCGTTNCHGSEKGAGHLKLFNVAGKNERVDYTNFLILDGTARRGVRMFDRQTPRSSMLLQYGLPADQAEFKHPRNLTPIFKSAGAENYRRVESWINSLQTPHPDYRLKWQPPLGMKLDFSVGANLPSAASEPASKPAN